MTLTKADIAQKIANDRGFMKNEAAEVLENMLTREKPSVVLVLLAISTARNLSCFPVVLNRLNRPLYDYES